MQILSCQTSSMRSSRVLVDPKLVPRRANVNDEAEEEGDKEVQDADAHPLEDIEFGRHFIENFLLFVYALACPSLVLLFFEH